MIYEMLLIQEGGMFIPSDTFVRRDYGRTGSIPYECKLCGLVFLSPYGCAKHGITHHSCVEVAAHRLLDTLLPGVSISLLQTCRLVRLEASPILYSGNSFHFCDPTTASNFRWSTHCAQVGAIQEIGIKFGSQFYDNGTAWVKYITKQTLSFGQDFPHLRRMTINVDMWHDQKNATLLRSMSEKLRERSMGLEWVLVLRLRVENVLDYLEPLVDRGTDSNHGQKEVRRFVWARQTGSKLKKALLWWGSPGEAVPHKYRMIGNQPTQ